MIFGEPMPFEEAAEYLRKKKLLPTTLSSAEIRDLGAEVTRRSLLSARVTQADFLQLAQDLVTKIAGGLDEAGGVAGSDPDVRGVTIAEGKAQLRELLQRIGYDPQEKEGTIKDLTSDARLQLIVETNVLDAQGRGRHEAAQDEIDLDVNPGWELVRLVTAVNPRDWPERWAAALAETTTEGATAPGSGRMVALKNHPVWQALGDGAGGYTDTLGNPWPPFAFNSGMNVVDVPRAECVQLGLLSKTTRVPTAAETADDPQALTVDANRFDASIQAALAADPALRLENGVLTNR